MKIPEVLLEWVLKWQKPDMNKKQSSCDINVVNDGKAKKSTDVRQTCTPSKSHAESVQTSSTFRKRHVRMTNAHYFF